MKNNEKAIAKLKSKSSAAMSKLGALGGSVTKLRYGREHYSRIAKKSWESRRKKAA